jgi:hydrogenase/urease accessory protein HupE
MPQHHRSGPAAGQPRPVRRTLTGAAVSTAGAGLVLAATAAPAAAHGIGGDATHRTVLGFIPLGFEHMLLGWDHLLFIAGVLLIARDWRRAAKLITVFVLGHSTTLIIATLAGWRVDAGAVDIVIGLSVVMVGMLGMFFPSVKWGPFTAVVAGFGLIHGLGLATRLQDIGLPEDGVLWRVIAFNVGVEIGQLTAILVMVTLSMLLETFVKEAPEAVLRKLGSVVVFAGGVAATAVVAFQTISAGTGDDVIAAETATDTACVEGERTTALPAAGGHTAKVFYGPGEEAPLGDFGHSVGDGYVAVLYPADLALEDVDALRAWVEGEAGMGVVAGPHPDDTTQVQALTARGQLNCDVLDVEALTDYKTNWFNSF